MDGNNADAKRREELGAADHGGRTARRGSGMGLDRAG
jgi:hypothetical protein